MDRLVETTREILSSEVSTIRSMTSLLLAWFSEHRKLIALLVDRTKTLHLSPESRLWSITNDATQQRLRRIRSGIESFRTIVQCRAKSFAPSEHSATFELTVYDFERFLVPRVGLTATYEVVDDTIRILRETARYLIERSTPLRTILDNIQRVESDTREMSRIFQEMLLETNIDPNDTRKISVDADSSVTNYKSIERSEAEQRSLALQSSIDRLNELLARAPTEAQIRLQQTLRSMQDIFEREENRLVETWSSKERDALEAISRLATTRDAVRRISEATRSIERLRDTVQRSISRETREILSLRDKLKGDNDRLEETGQNAYHRILHELQISRRNDTGSTRLEQREKDYVRDKITTSGVEGDDSTVTIDSTAMRQWQRNFCNATCDVLLHERDDAIMLETRVNRARDRLTAFLYRYGDDVFLRDVREIARKKSWSNPRAVLLPDKQSSLASWKKGSARVTDKLRNERKDTYDRFFSIDWSLLNRVNSSTVDAILNVFEIRYSPRVNEPARSIV